MQIDLSPFGFTSTENKVYQVLLDGGPAGGYAVAKSLGIARANAYEALAGLVSKGAATEIAGRPARVRVIRPDALLALIVARDAARLEVLERQVRRAGVSGATQEVAITSHRALADLATRVIVRDAGTVTCAAPADFLATTKPAWRKRDADSLASEIWLVGDGEPGPGVRRGDASKALDLFGRPVVLLAGQSGVLAATLEGEEVSGFWAQDQLRTGLVRSAIASVAGS